MIVWAIVITWVILAILFIISDEFNVPQLAYIIAFPVYIVLFPIIKGYKFIYSVYIRNNYSCYRIGSSTFILNHKLVKMFNPEKVKLYLDGKDFKSLPHKQELIDSVDELRQMGYTDKFIKELMK
jgi:hypothetical protein